MISLVKSDSDKIENYFQHLPNEIIQRIFSILPTESLRKCLSTSKNFYFNGKRVLLFKLEKKINKTIDLPYRTILLIQKAKLADNSQFIEEAKINALQLGSMGFLNVAIDLLKRIASIEKNPQTTLKMAESLGNAIPNMRQRLIALHLIELLNQRLLT